MRMIFVNLPVRDVAASKQFFAKLGFSHNPQFSNDEAVSIVIDENIVVMLLAESRFRDFIKQPISDANQATEVANALSCASREEVDALQAKAMAAGARPWMPPQDHGFMYGTSFQDPDGHVWELMWMDPAAVAR
ncbi:MAG TPA: VOC family protein [Devosiaceae bacterium]|nr:VOC family protein [Devosiaceae bacterium]